MKVKDNYLIKNFDAIFNKKIVLYGAGYYGKQAYNIIDKINLTDHIYCFCESNAEEWIHIHKSSTFFNVPVKNLIAIKEFLNQEDILLIITAHSDKNKEILNRIETVIPEFGNIFTWFGLCFSIGLNIDNCRIPVDFRNSFCLLRDCWRSTAGISSTASEAYKLYNNDNILVYQSGKVGSTAVCDSILHYGLQSIHIHDILNYNSSKYGYHKDIEKMYKYWLEHYARVKKYKIISLVRDPIARSISAYFQHFHEFFTLNDSVTCDTLGDVQRFIENEKHYGQDGYMFQWFREEMELAFGIDIYQYSFDKEKGYGFIKNENVELLLLTVEKISQNESTIGNFLGISDFHLVKSNLGINKAYSFLYHEVLKEIEIGNDILDFYYNGNSSMDHFYNPQQKQTFRRKWENYER